MRESVVKLKTRREKDSNWYWNRFAQEDPHAYILTTLKKPEPQAFWQSGEQTVLEELLPVIRASGVRQGIALELGCGVGRLAFPLARHFHDVVGMDVAEGMIRRALAYAHHNGVRNTRFVRISSPEDALHEAGNYVGKVDFLYSLLVLQHIGDFSVIEEYLHVIAALLEETGYAYLQFDTRPQSIAYRMKTALPDSLLPWFWRRGIRRIRRSTGEIAPCLTRAGLDIVWEETPGTAYHRYLLKRSCIAEKAG
jgi:SAM-dependent methyltransferase